MRVVNMPVGNGTLDTREVHSEDPEKLYTCFFAGGADKRRKGKNRNASLVQETRFAREKEN